MVHVAIVGTGDLAHGLAHVFKNNNTKSSGNTVAVTKPSFEKQTATTTDFHFTGVPLRDFYETVGHADIVVLAIPAYALEGFIKEYSHMLQGKILVDPTNSWKANEDVHAFLAGKDADFRWVKAFNDVGAVDLLNKHPQMKKPIASKMCSPDDDALELVKDFAETSLGFCIKKVPFKHYSAIASHQNQMAGGEEWMDAIWLMVTVFVVTQTYSILRYNIAKGVSYRSFPTFLMNKGIAWTALTGFALTQVPGILAHMSSLYYSNSLHTKHKYLRRFLAMRKHLGLISLWFLILHIFMSSLIFGPNYYSAYFIDPKDPMSKMSLNGELAFMCGCFGASLYVILGICSLPSVSEHMTNRQWQFVYGPVTWAALFFGTFHVIPQGVGVTWDKKEKWPWGLPPITLLSTILPMFIMTLKICQVIWSMAANANKKRKKLDNSDQGYLKNTAMRSNSNSGGSSDAGSHDDSKSLTHSTKLSKGRSGECEIYIDVGSMPYFCENEIHSTVRLDNS